jgi:HSP20 family protein
MTSAITRDEVIVNSDRSADLLARVVREIDELACVAQSPMADHSVHPNNLLDTWRSYVLQVELPGIDPDTLHIDVRYRRVSIDGKHRIPIVDSGTYLRRSIAGGEFHQVFDVPVEVDGSRAKAVYDCGILTLTLPKVAHLMSASVPVFYGG